MSRLKKVKVYFMALSSKYPEKCHWRKNPEEVKSPIPDLSGCCCWNPENALIGHQRCKKTIFGVEFLCGLVSDKSYVDILTVDS